GKSKEVLSIQLPIELKVLDTWNLPWGPGVDGVFLPGDPLRRIERGEHNQVPMIIGSNADETEVFIPPAVFGCGGYDTWLKAALPNQADEVAEQYPCEDFSSPRNALVNASTDLLFTCPARRASRLFSVNQTEPVFRYHYRYRRADPVLRGLGAYHASEIAMVFGTYDRVAYTPPPHESDLSAVMRFAWTNFARTGDPIMQGWEPYDSKADNVLVLNANADTGLDIYAEEGFDRAECDYWEPSLPQP
ncbi:MAG: carboxylesterase family protein, partial [Myxococcota bacterium]